MALKRKGKRERERIWRKRQRVYVGSFSEAWGVTPLVHEDTTNARKDTEPDRYPQHPETLKRSLAPPLAPSQLLHPRGKVRGCS